MQITVKKTSKRHIGSDLYPYYVDIRPTETNEYSLTLEKFYELRVWCWDTWGPSREVNEFTDVINGYAGDKNHAWSWINDHHRARLYLGGPEEAMHFTLKWS